jgi:hypothetical protein
MFKKLKEDRDFRAAGVTFKILGIIAFIQLFTAPGISLIVNAPLQVIEAVFRGIACVAMIIAAVLVYEKKWVRVTTTVFWIIMTVVWIGAEIFVH